VCERERERVCVCVLLLLLLCAVVCVCVCVVVVAVVCVCVCARKRKGPINILNITRSKDIQKTETAFLNGIQIYSGAKSRKYFSSFSCFKNIKIHRKRERKYFKFVKKFNRLIF